MEFELQYFEAHTRGSASLFQPGLMVDCTMSEKILLILGIVAAFCHF